MSKENQMIPKEKQMNPAENQMPPEEKQMHPAENQQPPTEDRKKSTFGKKLPVIGILALVLIFGGVYALSSGKGSADEAEQQALSVVSDPMESDTGDETKEILPQLQAILDAFDATMAQDTYGVSAKIHMNLDSKLFGGEYNSDLEAEISHDKEGNLQLDSTYTTDQDDTTLITTYKDGICYVDDGKETTEEEKSPDEVMESITEVRDFVEDAAAYVNEVQEETEDGDSTYTFTVADYLAEDYISTALENIDNEDLEGITIRVDSDELAITVNSEGQIKACVVTMEGNFHKAILSIPVKMKVKTSFS